MLSPSRIFYALLVCSENLFNALALVCVLLFLSVLRSEASGKCLLFSALTGIGTALLSAIRPNGLIYVVSFIVLDVIFMARNGGMRRRKTALIKAAWCGVLIFSYFAASLVVTAAVEAEIGQPVAVVRFGWNLYVGMNFASDGAWNPQDAEQFGLTLSQYGPQDAQLVFSNLGIQRLRAQLHEGTLPLFLINKASGMWFADHEAYMYLCYAQAPDIQSPIVFGLNNKPVKLVCDVYYDMLLLL